MAGPDLSVVTAMVDFSTVVEAVLFVAAAIAYVYVAVKGAKMLLAAARGGSSYDYYTYEDYARDNQAAGLAVMSREEYEEHPF
jgi:hypothetical protein